MPRGLPDDGGRVPVFGPVEAENVVSCGVVATDRLVEPDCAGADVVAGDLTELTACLLLFRLSFLFVRRVFRFSGVLLSSLASPASSVAESFDGVVPVEDEDDEAADEDGCELLLPR